MSGATISDHLNRLYTDRFLARHGRAPGCWFFHSGQDGIERWVMAVEKPCGVGWHTWTMDGEGARATLDCDARLVAGDAGFAVRECRPERFPDRLPT